LPTVASAVAQTLNGHPANHSQLRGGWIDYRGPPGTVRSLSFQRVLQDHFDSRAVRGKVVVVGATAPLLQDLHSTSVGGPMSGPEVQAQAISTALSGFPLRGSPGSVTVLLIILLALLVPVVGVRVGTLGSGLVGLGIFGAWSLATQLAFDQGTVLDYSDPLASLLLGIGGTLTMTLWADSRERRRLRTLFAANSAAVVDQVLHPSGPRPLEPTAIIAGYRIEEVVGRGGMGVVYRATQLALQRTVAIKLIATERTQDPAFRERFKLESRIAASIEHANVVPVYEAGEDDGLLFIAMRLVEGVDLAQLLGRLGSLEPTRAVRIGSQLAGALDAAHARGLVHRDVKPANVLLTVDEPEHAYLTDFGVAKQIGASAGVTRIDQWVGTLDYLAPEQIRGDPVDERADIYALAGLLHHCLTGQTPFPRDTAPPSPIQLRPSLPQALDDVIARGMAKDPARRFATAAELAHACAHALGIPRAVSNPPAPPVTPGQISKGSGGVASTAISE
jgi:Protein kinase domain/CHASE2 domain